MNRKAIVNMDTSAIADYLELCEKVNKKTAELIPLLEELRTAELTLSYEITQD